MAQIINPPDPPPAGLRETIDAAGHTARVEWNAARTGVVWEVDDATAVQAIISSYVGSATELAYHQGVALAALAVEYAGKYAAGFNYTGSDSVKRNFQIDPGSCFNIDVEGNAALGAILNGETWNAQSFWIASDNSQMPLATAPAARTFALAVKAYVQTLILTNNALKASINAAATVAAVQAIDVTQGWPSNP